MEIHLRICHLCWTKKQIGFATGFVFHKNGSRYDLCQKHINQLDKVKDVVVHGIWKNPVRGKLINE